MKDSVRVERNNIMSTYTYADAPECGVYIHESQAEIPEGFRLGAHVSRPGRAYKYVIRIGDGVAVLCPMTPASDEVLDMDEMAEELHAACDEAKRGDE
jgi:hypothetical protein